MKKRIRPILWVASLAWVGYFLIYGLIMLPALLKVLKWLWPGENFYVWSTMVFYVLCIFTVVMIFLWFFARLWRRK